MPGFMDWIQLPSGIPKQTISQEFKLSVIQYLHTHQNSRAQTAAHFAISSSQVKA